MRNVREILISRDGMSGEDADELINEMRKRVYAGEDLEEVLYEISLEPDYIFDIL